MWSGDPKVKIFKDTMKSTYYDGYKGPISTATGAVNADYVLVQMCASVATGAATPEAAAAEAERRAKRYFRRRSQRPVKPSLRSEREAIQSSDQSNLDSMLRYRSSQ